MATIIALLLSLGLIGSQADFDNLNQTQQDELIEIVINDDIDY